MSESQPWEIQLPDEDMYLDRALEARNEDGALVARWVPRGGMFMCTERPALNRRGGDSFAAVFMLCWQQGHRLYSVPAHASDL